MMIIPLLAGSLLIASALSVLLFPGRRISAVGGVLFCLSLIAVDLVYGLWLAAAMTAVIAVLAAYYLKSFPEGVNPFRTSDRREFPKPGILHFFTALVVTAAWVLGSRYILHLSSIPSLQETDDYWPVLFRLILKDHSLTIGIASMLILVCLHFLNQAAIPAKKTGKELR